MAAAPSPHELADEEGLRRSRWHPLEVVFWAAPLPAFFLMSDRRQFVSQIFICGLLALSLDLIVGYAGILSLGHAAFFGVGAYTAGLLARHGWSEPLSGLALAAIAAGGAGYAASFLVVRGANLTRLMVTLGIALLLEALAERFSNITGGSDGLQGIEMQPILGLFAFDMFGKVGFFYCLAVLFILFLLARRIVHSPFGLSLRAIRNNPLRASAIGIPVNLFTVIFATGRTPGWVAHWHEMISNPFKIGRPRQLYTGPKQRDYPG